MRYAFLLMSGAAAGERAALAGEDSQMVAVASVAGACDEARRLAAEGVDAIELCGAFGEDGARAVIEATGGALPVGYVTHFPEQDALFSAVFGD